MRVVIVVALVSHGRGSGAALVSPGTGSDAGPIEDRSFLPSLQQQCKVFTPDGAGREPFTPGLPIHGVRYIPHLVGEPYPHPTSSPAGHYTRTFAQIHKRDLPIIGKHLGADTLGLSPWPTDGPPSQHDGFFSEMHAAGVCKIIPTFHVAKYYADMLRGGFDQPKTDPSSPFAVDFSRFGASVREQSLKGINMVAWSVDLSLDLSRLLPMVGKECSTSKVTQDDTFQKYMMIMDAMQQWVHPSSHSESVAPALAQVPFLVPLDMSRVSWTEPYFNRKLNTFVNCMSGGGWSSLFSNSAGAQARWLLSYSLPTRQHATYNFAVQLRNVTRTLSKRAVIMVGTQALSRGSVNPINRANLVEDFFVDNARYQDPYADYLQVQNETDRLDGFIYDEWMDDWDRGIRGPFFLATKSLEEMKEPCPQGGRFNHDIKGCSRDVGNNGLTYPEFFGLMGSSSQILRHCIHTRFNESFLGRGRRLALRNSSDCAFMLPSTTWVVVACALLAFVLTIHTIKLLVQSCREGCCCARNKEQSPKAVESPAKNEQQEQRTGYVTIRPRELELRSNHSIELHSSRHRSDEEVGWWLWRHISSQMAVLEKQVDAELNTTVALKARKSHRPELVQKSSAHGKAEAEADLESLETGSEDDDDLSKAMQVVHKRALEGFAAWCHYVAGAGTRSLCVSRLDLGEVRASARAIEENHKRPPATLFAEALVLRTMESVGEQILQCPERLSYILFHIFKEAGGLEDIGPVTYTIDLDQLHDGLYQMNQHSDPYTRRKMPNGKKELGLNFDDINESGIQCRDGVAKTFKEPSSIMVAIDFFLCYRVAIVLKLYCVAVSGYIYLGSQRGYDISTSHNGSLFSPQWLRINYIQYIAILDAILWTFIEMLLVVYVAWQRWPSLCWKSPGIPGLKWLAEHMFNICVSMLGGVLLHTEAQQSNLWRRKPWECAQSDMGTCRDPRADIVWETLQYAFMYWGCRLVIFTYMNAKHVPIFLYGTPDSKVRADSGRGSWANRGLNFRANFAWICMLGACVLIEVRLLLPTMKGLDWNTTCGLDVLGEVVGLPSQRGVCTEPGQLWTFGCMTCLSSTSAGWMLVFLGTLVDIYFVFYLATSLVGSYMGHTRDLNDLRNVSLPIDLRENQGREAILFARTFGPGWQQIWRMMVKGLCQESFISPKQATALVQAAGVSMDGEVPSGAKDRQQKPIHLTRFPDLAAERLAFFFQSLKWIENYKPGKNMGFEPATDALTGPHFDPGTIPSLSQIIPVYNETVLPSLEFLRAGAEPENARNGSPDDQPGLGDMTAPPEGDGVNTNLAFMISQFPDEWVFLAKRLNVEGWLGGDESDILYTNFIQDKLRLEIAEEVQLWAAFRMQTVAKTVIGALQYGRALGSLPKIKEHYAKLPEKRVPEDHVEVILAHQTYGHAEEGSEKNDKAVRLLMEKFADDALFLVFDLKKGSSPELWRMVETEMIAKGGYIAGCFEQASVKCKWDKVRRGLRVLDVLPRQFELRLGQGEFKTQGKAGNQLNGLRFATGHYVQALDCNMGAFIGETFKIPYVLRSFMPLDKEDRTAPMCRYLGFREYIYTKREGTVGKCLASAEWTFGTITQRFLSGMGMRMHYGHPDFLDGFWARNRGGMSKSSAVVNLSEDLFAGYNVRMREEASPHIDALEFEKGREATFNASSAFFSKIAGGSIAVLRSRDNHLLCDRIGLLHSLSFYFSSVAFYVSNLLVDYSISVYVAIFILFELAGLGPGELAALGSTFSTEWIISMGLVTLVPQLCEMVLEFGAVRSIKQVIGSLFSATFFYIFQNKSIASAMKEGAATGMARYLSTGRPLANQHQTWKDCYVAYWKSHYQPALTLMVGYLIYSVLAAQNDGKGKLPMLLVVISFVAWLITPILFSSFPRWNLIRQDLHQFSHFVTAGAGAQGVDANEVMTRGKRGTARSLYECGLADEMISWTEAPLFMIIFWFVVKVAGAVYLAFVLPSEILDFMPVCVVALSFSWVIVLCYYIAGLNNVFLVLSFLVWPATVPLAHFIIGPRFSQPDFATRMPEYIISLTVFLYVLGLIKEFVLILCRVFYLFSPAGEVGKKARGRLCDCIRLCFVYFLVHQTQIAEAYTILIVNTAFSSLLAAVDKIFCNAHTWWLLNNELARTKRDERYMESNKTFYERDGLGYSLDLWSTDSDLTPRSTAV